MTTIKNTINARGIENFPKADTKLQPIDTTRAYIDLCLGQHYGNGWSVFSGQYAEHILLLEKLTAVEEEYDLRLQYLEEEEEYAEEHADILEGTNYSLMEAQDSFLNVNTELDILRERYDALCEDTAWHEAPMVFVSIPEDVAHILAADGANILCATVYTDEQNMIRQYKEEGTHKGDYLHEDYQPHTLYVMAIPLERGEE